ncbi:MAG: MauE/DoxX family redox-associated membrane protein, partial [Thermomicrobiales bacterium]
MRRSQWLGRIPELGLSAVFLVSGLAKVRSQKRSLEMIHGYGIPMRLAKPISYVLAPVELLMAVGLASRRYARIATAGGTGLLIVFSAVISRSMASGKGVPSCSCFGSLGFGRSAKAALLRNGILTAIAGGVLLMTSPKARTVKSTQGRINLFGRPNGRLLGIVLGQTLFIAYLLRAYGLSLISPAGRNDGVPLGPRLGEVAPHFQLNGCDGKSVSSQDLFETNWAVGLLFVLPGCEECAETIGAIHEMDLTTSNGRPQIALVCAGDRATACAELKNWRWGRVLI